MITIYISITYSPYLMTKPLGHKWDGRLEAPLGATGFECPGR